MNSEQKKVLEFHKTFSLPIAKKPTTITKEAAKRRFYLLAEEVLELDKALLDNDIVEIADAIADVLYVAYGTAVECGIDIQPIFNEVHKSNMTKIGGTFNEFGKLVKPSTYTPPNLLPIIKLQGKA